VVCTTSSNSCVSSPERWWRSDSRREPERVLAVAGSAGSRHPDGSARPEGAGGAGARRCGDQPSLPRAYFLVPNRASGSVVEDADRNLFLDFNAGIAVNSTGHCHPRVVAAVRSQAEQLLHYSASDFYLPIYSQMCEALIAVLPISGHKRVFLTNSGAEAVEGAMKLTRYATGRPYIISFFGAFHGRTYGAVSLTASKAKYHKGFAPLLAGILHAPYAFSQRDPETGKRTHDEEATFDYLENALFRYQVPPTEVAAIFLEPVQGEGGYIVPPASWVQRLRALCDKYGILLVADEVQSGMGRTGKMWAIELADVEPDILISAKGMASGLPLGAFAAKSELMERWGQAPTARPTAEVPCPVRPGSPPSKRSRPRTSPTTPRRSGKSCSRAWVICLLDSPVPSRRCAGSG
jgi:4-aminobutyrate aminotransferase-like enzyme